MNYFILLNFAVVVVVVVGTDVRVSTGSASIVNSSNNNNNNGRSSNSSSGNGAYDLDNLLMADASPTNTLTSCQDNPRQLRMLAISQRSIILYCDVSTAVAAHDHLIQWKREPDLAPIFARQGTFLPYIHPSYEGRLSIVDDALLKIDPVQESDEGWYRCEIHFTRPEMCPRTPNRVHLSVQSHPQLLVNESSPDQLNRPAGSSEVVLRCAFLGTPQPEVTWTKYSWHRGYEVLRPSSRIAIASTSLTIRSFNKMDSGRYQCRAANLVGEATHQISLVADGSVVLIVPPSNVTVEEGDEAVFHCKIDGYPSRITYRWFRDGMEIAFPPPLATISSSEVASVGEPTAVRTRIDRFAAIHSGQSSVLVVNPANRKDSGRYSCEGSNGEAVVRTPEAFLSVKFKPIFVNMKSFVFLPLALAINLTCSAEANPPITKYSWAKGNNFDITGNRFRFSEDGRILTITNVSRDDAGTYICFITNDLSTDKFEIEVQVTDPPTFSAVPRPLTQVIKGSGVTIACKASATIMPVISWMKDGQPLELTDRIQIMDGNLIIHDINADDQGEYLCLAHNAAATVVQKTRIVVEDESRPHAPRNLTVDTGAYSATLSWLPAYNRGLQSYIVQYRAIATPDLKLASNRPVSPPPWQQMRVFPEGALTFTIYNLLPNSTYEFRVMARSYEPGDGLYSLPVLERTKPIERDDAELLDSFFVAPDEIANSVAIKGVDEDEEEEQQKKKDNNNDYEEEAPVLTIRTLSSRSNSQRGPKTVQPQTMMTSSTKAMVSDRSVDLVSHPESLMYAGPKPPAPRNVTGTSLPRSIHLRWAPPENLTSSSKTSAALALPPSHTCYTVEFMAGTETDWRQLANVSAATDSFVLSNPTPKTVYRFRVAACNAKTIGYYSDTIVLTSEDVSGLMQVSTETALLGVAGCAVVLVIIISVVVVCVRYNRPPSPYDRHRQRQCKFVSIDGASGGSPLTSTPPNKMLNGNGNYSKSNGANYVNGNGLLTTATHNGHSTKMLSNGKNGCPQSASLSSCNGALLLGSSSSSSNSGGTATLPKDRNGQWLSQSQSQSQQQHHCHNQQQLQQQQQQQQLQQQHQQPQQSKQWGELPSPSLLQRQLPSAACHHQPFIIIADEAGAARANCRHCRGGGVMMSTGEVITRRQLTLERPSQQSSFINNVFPNINSKNQRGSSSSGEDIVVDDETQDDDDDDDNADECTRLSQIPAACSSSLNRQPSNSNQAAGKRRPLGRLEALLLMDEESSCKTSSTQQQAQKRVQGSHSGDYDNISSVCDSCGVGAVDGLYVRSRSPLGRFLDGNMHLSHNASTATTDVTSRSSSLDTESHPSSTNPASSTSTNNTTTLYSLVVSSSTSPRSPLLSEMTTPPPPLTIYSTVQPQHLNNQRSLLLNCRQLPPSPPDESATNSSAASSTTGLRLANANNHFDPNAMVSETCI